jgi:STE24 endopeptidase
MRFRKLALLLCLVAPICLTPAARASETPTEHSANVAAAQEMAAAPPNGNLPDYSLPPDQLVKAQQNFQIGNWEFFGDLIWGILQLVLLLWLGAIAWMRDKAVSVSENRWAQGFVFLLLFLIADFILDLPLRVLRHHLGLVYGFSVQGWGSWFVDQAKTFVLTWIVGGFLMMLLFNRIRKYPRRWWLVFWAVSVPIGIAAVFITPYVIDPLFNKFEPLQQTNPALVEQLEKVVAKGNMNIPPEKMFLMKASAKVTTMNAYVTGFGASKRVVVWDTSLQKGTPDEVLFIFGHESGHYVLGHIVRGIIFSQFGILLALYLGYRFVQWAIRRYGDTWRVPSQEDWGALAVLLLAFTILGALGGPIEKAFSRNQEHAADVYGQEAIHGIVADPQVSATKAFDVLGESSLDQPNESDFIEFMMEDHPSVGRRAAFAAHYDPWAPGAEPKYFNK